MKRLCSCAIEKKIHSNQSRLNVVNNSSSLLETVIKLTQQIILCRVLLSFAENERKEKNYVMEKN